MTLTQTAPQTATTIKIWEAPTAEAQVGDIIRKPFCPIARIVGKEILADGRTCLIITFPGCHDRHVEEWILEVSGFETDKPAPAPTPATATLPAKKNASIATPAPVPTPATPTPAPAKKLDSIFGERVKEKGQFLIIKDELSAIGIKVGTLINSRSDAKGWNLAWGKDKAGLFWTTGNGWEVESAKPGTELSGQWEGFDLIEHLACNGIDLDEETATPATAPVTAGPDDEPPNRGDNGRGRVETATAKKLMLSLVSVKRISSDIPACNFDPQELEIAGEMSLAIGGFVVPPVLVRDASGYKVLSGHFQYHAAVLARRLNPRAGETIPAIVLETENQATGSAMLKMLKFA
ncbi:hypothetical protein QUB68_29670, partial [Microcoleus sp. A006_D1]|uniref:hypothetical protein n=1 Tax=Microcoleus sp. A006_D1 TaxID=3055267 RepID=UPI002FD417DE